MKAHQRLIREQLKLYDNGGLFGYPKDIDIKKSVLKEVDYLTAKNIIEKYEWLGTMGTTQFYYGIYFDNVCAGVICFGFFQAMAGYSGFIGDKYADKGIQLSRGACVWWAHEHSGSKLIGFGLREMEKKGYKYVIAFSDPEAGEIGTLYQATNWHYIGFGNTKHYNIVINDGKFFMNDRDFNKKYGYKNLNIFLRENPTLELQIIKPKGRYIKLLGSKSEQNEMMSVLKNRIKPYPKRIF